MDVFYASFDPEHVHLDLLLPRDHRFEDLWYVDWPLTGSARVSFRGGHDNTNLYQMEDRRSKVHVSVRDPGGVGTVGVR